MVLLSRGSRTFATTTMDGLTVVICGGGNGTHVLAGLAPTVNDFKDVYVLSTFSDEAKRITEAASSQDGEIHVRRCREGPNGEDILVKGKPTKVTNDPSVVAEADLIVFVMPAFAHGGYLKAIKPYLRKTGSKAPGGRVILGAMPGESGFDAQAQSILGEELFGSIALFALQTLPWAARLAKYGKLVDVLGTKLAVDIAVTPAPMGKEVVGAVQKLMASEFPRLNLIPSMLTITLMNPNQIAHPTITWGQYRDWDGKTPFDQPPPFYDGVTKEMDDMMSKISDEMLEIKKFLETNYNLDLTGFLHLKDWMVFTYGDKIGDQSSLYSIFHSFEGYRGLTHPMIKTKEGKYLPNFQHRYLSEDVPLGLIVTKGVAELCGIKTPNMDIVIDFCSKAYGKSFIKDGKVAGPDVGITRSPQAYGITSIDEFMKRLHY